MPDKPKGTMGGPRHRALEIGTDPSGFPADLPYDTQAGMPTGLPGQGGTHKDNVGPELEQPPPMPPVPKPFK